MYSLPQLLQKENKDVDKLVLKMISNNSADHRGSKVKLMWTKLFL
jgi:hypothetical protein